MTGNTKWCYTSKTLNESYINNCIFESIILLLYENTQKNYPVGRVFYNKIEQAAFWKVHSGYLTTTTSSEGFLHRKHAMADAGFPRRGGGRRQPQRGEGHANLFFGNMFAENCMKVKERGVPTAPSWIGQWHECSVLITECQVTDLVLFTSTPTLQSIKTP